MMNPASKKRKEELVLRALERNGMTSFYAPDRASALERAVSFIEPGDMFGVGGSVTLAEIGLIEVLKSGKARGGTFTFIDQHREGLCRDEAIRLRNTSLEADLFSAAQMPSLSRERSSTWTVSATASPRSPSGRGASSSSRA